MLEMLTDMFGKECIGKMIKGNNISVTVDENVALVNVESLVGTVLCVSVCGRGEGVSWTSCGKLLSFKIMYYKTNIRMYICVQFKFLQI